MATKEELIRAALKGFPGADLLPLDVSRMTMHELLEAARNNDFGDTLVGFVIFELHEALDEDRKGQVDPEQAVRLIDRAAADLDTVSRVIQALFCPNTGLFVVVETHQGVISDVTVCGSRREAGEREKAWLKEQGIRDEAGREARSQDGTEIRIVECALR